MSYVLDKEDLELERYCYKCGYATQSTCQVCKGTGLVPTDFGNQVLDFVRRHLALEVKVKSDE
jgi:hypothetical protein